MDHILSRAAGCRAAAYIAVAITALSAAQAQPVIVTSLTEVGLVTSHGMAAQRPVHRDRLGFTVEPSEFVRDKSFTDVNGLCDALVRMTRATRKDGPALELVVFKDLPRKAIEPRIQDPGAMRLQLMAPDARGIGPRIALPSRARLRPARIR